MSRLGRPRTEPNSTRSSERLDAVRVSRSETLNRPYARTVSPVNTWPPKRPPLPLRDRNPRRRVLEPESRRSSSPGMRWTNRQRAGRISHAWLRRRARVSCARSGQPPLLHPWKRESAPAANRVPCDSALSRATADRTGSLFLSPVVAPARRRSDSEAPSACASPGCSWRACADRSSSRHLRARSRRRSATARTPDRPVTPTSPTRPPRTGGPVAARSALPRHRH
jgi:hypothetical protein